MNGKARRRALFLLRKRLPPWARYRAPWVLPYVRIRNKIHFALNRRRPSEAEIEREAVDVVEWYATFFVGAECDTKLDEWLRERAEDERDRWAPPHVVAMFERAAERARDPQNEILEELRRMQARRAMQRALGRKPANDRPHTQPAQQNRAREPRSRTGTRRTRTAASGDDPPPAGDDDDPEHDPLVQDRARERGLLRGEARG